MEQSTTPRQHTYATHTEVELVAASRDGYAAAYAELWSRNHRLVYSVARAQQYRSSGDTGDIGVDADDIVAEAFACVWEQMLNGGGPKVAFKAYIVQVARNISVRNFRASLATITNVELEEEFATGLTTSPFFGIIDDTADATVRYEEQQAALTAFKQLPESWQQVIWWQDVEDISRTEVAKRLGLSLNAVSALRRRAQSGLRQAYRESPVHADAMLLAG